MTQQFQDCSDKDEAEANFSDLIDRLEDDEEVAVGEVEMSSQHLSSEETRLAAGKSIEMNLGSNSNANAPFVEQSASETAYQAVQDIIGRI